MIGTAMPVGSLHETERLSRGIEVYIAEDEINAQGSSVRLKLKPVLGEPRDPQELLDKLFGKKRRAGLEEDASRPISDDHEDPPSS